MDALSLIEELESLSPDQLDTEIRHQEERLVRMKLLRKLICGSQRGPRVAKGDRPEVDQKERQRQVVAALEALGPSKAGVIADNVGLAPQAVGLVLRAVSGAEQDENKVWSIASQRKRK